jgi:oligoendopeptidase F
MKDSFPVFRRYLNHKATKLGKEKLPWWDLFAPVGDAEMKYTYGEMCNYVIDQFGSFTPEMADFARNAFENNWIDAEPRDGKRGGAFWMEASTSSRQWRTNWATRGTITVRRDCP